MFNPSREDVRRFFCDTWAKRTQVVLAPMESIALRWMIEHPEYHSVLERIEDALATDYSVEKAISNPFLHLSMHLSLAEQIQADQPQGIKSLSRDIMEKMGSEHDMHHALMECLGEVLWNAQRKNSLPDMLEYLGLVQQLRNRLLT